MFISLDKNKGIDMELSIILMGYVPARPEQSDKRWRIKVTYSESFSV